MKKIASFLCTVLTLCTLLATMAFAVEPTALSGLTETQEVVIYPAEVVEYMEGEAHRIKKVYTLDSGDNPAHIPTADFERDGYAYVLLDMTRQSQVEMDKKPHSESITLDSESKALDKILPQLAVTKDVTTPDGYTGTLTLDTSSIQVEAAQYGKSSRNVTATRSYPNLSSADVSLIPKTTEENGRTLTLNDVQWQETGGLFHATASYSGTATSSYVTSYIVTANYVGEVTKTVIDDVVYTAVFGGTPIPKPESERESEFSFAAAFAAINWNLAIQYALPIGLAVFILILLVAFIRHFTLKRKRRERKYK